MAFLLSSSRLTTSERRRRIQARSWRVQSQGWDQSRRRIMRVLGRDWGVRRGLRRGAKAGDGEARV
jgi:hypothetical protein